MLTAHRMMKSPACDPFIQAPNVSSFTSFIITTRLNGEAGLGVTIRNPQSAIRNR
jgi:hypothetical protein